MSHKQHAACGRQTLGTHNISLIIGFIFVLAIEYFREVDIKPHILLNANVLKTNQVLT